MVILVIKCDMIQTGLFILYYAGKVSPQVMIYGNAVISRNAASPTVALNNYLDFETVLPFGCLQRFNIYVHHTISTGVNESPGIAFAHSKAIRLQIWRPVDLASFMFKLVWEYRAVISNIPDSGGIFSVSVSCLQSVLAQIQDRPPQNS